MLFPVEPESLRNRAHDREAQAMNKAVPWSVKGVGFDAREAARQAAKKAGLPVGEWLNSVIADRAAEIGVVADDIDADARLEAVAARLADLSGGSATPASRTTAVKPADEPRPIRSESPYDPEWREPDAAPSRSIRPERGSVVDTDRWDADPVFASPETRRSQRQTMRDWEVDSLLDQAAERMERRAVAAIERSTADYRRATSSALAEVSDRIARAEAGRGAEYEALASITDRLVGLEQQVASPPETTYRPLKDALGSVAERLGELENRMTSRDTEAATKPIVSALARLEDRFERFTRRSTENRETARIEASVQDLSGRLAEVAQKLERAELAAPAKAGPEIERIDSKLASIIERLNQPRPVVAAPVQPAPVAEPPASPPAALQRTLGNAIADIARRQADLDRSHARRAGLLSETSPRSLDAGRAESPTQAPTADGTSPPPLPRRRDNDSSQRTTQRSQGDLDSLQDAFKALADRLETRLDDAAKSAAQTPDRSDLVSIQKEIAGLAGRFDSMERDPRSRAGADEIAALKTEIAALSEGLAHLAPNRSVSALEHAVRDLTERVEISRHDGVQESILAPVERLGSEIREAIRAIDPRATFEGLQREIKAISGRVDGLGAGGVDPEALKAIQQQTREMRDLLTQAASRPLAMDRIEEELAQLASRVDQLADTPPRLASRDLERSIGDIRGMLDRFSPDSFLDALERKMASFGTKIDALRNGAAPLERFDDLARRIDNVHEKVAARVAASEPAPKADLQPIEAMIGTLSGKLDSLSSAAADSKSLHVLVRGLAARLEEAHAPNADAKALDALEAQLGRLAERLDRSDANLDALSSLERAVGELFQQLEEARNLSVDAAETAARTAAQDTLRAALSNPSLNGSEASARAGAAADHVSREITEFRQVQENAEKRMNATLTALNTTLERLVDRMVTQTPDAKDKPAVAIKAPSAAAEPTRKRADARPARTDRDADPFLLEPGAGLVPDRAAADRTAASGAEAPLVEVVRPTAPDVAPLIAAARRAAQAAQASAAAASNKGPELKANSTANETSGASVAQRTRAFLAKRRRPLLLSLAGLVLLIGAAQIVKLTTESRNPPVEASAATDQPEVDQGSAPATDGKATAAAKPDNAPASKAGPSETALLTPPDAGSRKTATTFNAPSTPTAAPATLPRAGVAAANSSAADPSLASLSAGLRDLAAKGDAAAQFEAAVRFAEGRGVNRDPKLAAIWFEKAANQGLAPAQYRLGSLYEKGIGVAVDAPLASAWYEKAAAQGNIRAMHNLAVMAAEGSGAKPDYAKAATWFTKAANLGVRDSQFNLAILYARGLGIEQNLSQSYAWFSVAASEGDTDAAKKRDEVASKLDAKTLAAAKSVAENFHPSTPERAANEVPPPPGGWDAVAPAKAVPGSASKDTNRAMNISSM